jgi:hypothetical protein
MKFLMILNLLPWFVFSQTKESWITKPKTQCHYVMVKKSKFTEITEKAQSTQRFFIYAFLCDSFVFFVILDFLN